jgi:hypothetical protein
MSTLVVIPDIHHDWDWVEQILDFYGGEDDVRYIFLGDYFEYKRSRTYNHLQSLEWLIKTINRLGDRANWLIGNHDLHYHPVCLSRTAMLAASGFNYEAAQTIADSVPWHRLKVAHAEKGFLFTHAGLGVFDAIVGFSSPYELACALNKEWAQFGTLPSPDFLTAIGWGSGGQAEQGGIFWHRPEENSLAPFHQMMGHTPSLKPLVYHPANNQNVKHWYLDTQQNFWAEIDQDTLGVSLRSIHSSF